MDYCNFLKYDKHRLYSVEKEKDKYIIDYPKNIKNTIIALNKYIFEGFDYCFQKTDFILLMSFSGRLFPYMNQLYLPIETQDLSNHKKLLAQEELFNLLSKTD